MKEQKVNCSKEKIIEILGQFAEDNNKVCDKSSIAVWLENEYPNLTFSKPFKEREMMVSDETAAIIEEHSQQDVINEEIKHLQTLVDNKNAYIETIDNKNKELKSLAIELWQLWESLAISGEVSVGKEFIESYNTLKQRIDSL